MTEDRKSYENRKGYLNIIPPPISSEASSEKPTSIFHTLSFSLNIKIFNIEMIEKEHFSKTKVSLVTFFSHSRGQSPLGEMIQQINKVPNYSEVNTAINLLSQTTKIFIAIFPNPNAYRK